MQEIKFEKKTNTWSTRIGLPRVSRLSSDFSRKSRLG